MSASALDDILQRIDRIPTLPTAAARLIAAVHSPDTSMGEIAEIVRYDPAMAAEILRVCNSAQFGLGRTTDSIDDAARMLGARRLAQTVLAVYARTAIGSAQKGYGMPPGALWRHSVAVALVGVRIGQRMRIADTGELYTAGLLHDIGKMVLNESVGEQYARIAAMVREERITFLEAEGRVLGFTHAEAGGRLAERWGLPARLIACIRSHHEPSRAAELSPQLDAVHLADCICLTMGIGGGDDGLLYRPDEGAVERAGLGAVDLESIGAEAMMELRNVEALFAEGACHAPQHR